MCAHAYVRTRVRARAFVHVHVLTSICKCVKGLVKEEDVKGKLSKMGC